MQRPGDSMNKQFLLVTTFALAMGLIANANATGSQSKTTFCDFVDHMHIEDLDGEAQILNLSTNNFGIVKKNDRYFQIIHTCDNPKHNSRVIVKVGTDANHYAILSIHDAAYQFNPDILLVDQVGGFKYDGVSHPLGTFLYTLEFRK
jgi:hypothetical protein